VKPKAFPCPKGLHVTLEAEVRAVCPFTGAPDHYEVQVEYISSGACLEAHSLQEYLDGFRGRRITQEELTAAINEAVKEAVEPEIVCTRLTGSHGGVTITTEVCSESSPAVQAV